MSGSRPESLFPLPLTLFEMWMLADDDERFPMTFALRVAYSGEFDESAFRDAVPQALMRHPLLHAIVDRQPWRLPCWRSSPTSPIVTIRTVVEQVGMESQSTGRAEPLESALRLTRIDVTRQPGLSIDVESGATGGTTTFHFHHACCDAFGARQFVGDVFAIYGQLTDWSSPPLLLPINIAALRLRDRPARPTDDIGVVERWRLLIGRAYRALFRKPHPLFSRTSGLPEEAAVVAQSVVLSVAESRRLRQIAQQRKLTISDLLLIEVFRIARDWNQTPQGAPTNHRIRIMAPISQRGPDHAQMPAANCVSMVFPTFLADAIRDDRNFETSVAARMKQLENLRAGSWLTGILRFAARIPGGFELFSSKRKCQSTVVATYVGDVSHAFAARFPIRNDRCVAGRLILERFTSCTPLRFGTYANFSASSYAGELTINVTVDERHCGLGAAAKLADAICSRLLATS